VEITERTLMPRAASVLDNLNALHELGVAIALDDFGTGYDQAHWLLVEGCHLHQGYLHPTNGQWYPRRNRAPVRAECQWHPQLRASSS
jgi:EAL domain-containing protein (putative c-di-GMP-specific phosphodiesterase class I)